MRSLQQGDHLCLFYDQDPAEQMPALIPFIEEGLRKNEQFIYIADDQTVEQLIKHLEAAGIVTQYEMELGRLKLWTRNEWRQPGELSSEEKLEQVRQFIDDAMLQGFKGIRFAVEMTWTLGPDIPPEKLEHWEATLDTLFVPDFPGRIICQYNRSRLSPETLLAALHTHPLAIIDEQICPNEFYRAPMILQGNGRQEHVHGNGHSTDRLPSSDKVDWMISKLRQRRISKLEEELSERKKIEHASLHLAAIVESSEDAIISKNLQGIIQSWNSGAELIFGYTADEAIGKSILMLIPMEHRQEESEILSRIMRGDSIEHFETVRQRKDGSLIDISLTVSPIKDMEGTVIGASKIARDITQRKQAESELQKIRAELERVNEELENRVQERTSKLSETIAQMEEFSYSISHDLRAPARAMQGYAKAVLEDYGDRLDDTGRDYLSRIVRNSQRMDRLIQDILTYSKLTRRDILLHPVSLDTLVREIIQQYPEMHSPRVQITIANKLHSVLGHDASISQAVSNLLSNAVKFVQPGKIATVRIWTEPRGKNVRLWIEDQGVGISPTQHYRLFRMFERLHPDKNYEGTGIGLAIVRKATERMGGKVGVEPNGMQGSRFWIELPAA